MEDLKNKKLYKLLWLPNENEIIWDLKKELSIISSRKDIILNALRARINVHKWYNEYSILYQEWLNSDNPTIYDINSKINVEMINAIKLANNDLNKKNIILFYWFDIDRSLNEKWEWENDPLTNKPLHTLDSSYNNLNRKVSLDNFLTFPMK